MTEHHIIAAEIQRRFRMFDSHLRRLANTRAALHRSAPIRGDAPAMRPPTCEGAGAGAAGRVAEDARPRRPLPTFLFGELRQVG